MSVLRKNTFATVTSDDPLLFKMSDGSKDRHGDIVVARGIDLTEFNKNPIALANHDSSYVVGNWADVHEENGSLYGRLKMAPMGTSSRIDELRRLVYAGILKACSIGFIPEETKPLPGGGVQYIRSRLLECSVVATPSNPNALRAEAKALHVSETTIRKLIDRPPVNGSLAQRQQHAALSRKPLYTPQQRAKIAADNAARAMKSHKQTQRITYFCDRILALRAEAKHDAPTSYSDFADHDRHKRVMEKLAMYEYLLINEKF